MPSKKPSEGVLKGKAKLASARKTSISKKTSHENESWYSGAKERFSLSKDYSKNVAERILDRNKPQ